jgi:tetratricopeptide (TPR) repeat protein
MLSRMFKIPVVIVTIVVSSFAAYARTQTGVAHQPPQNQTQIQPPAPNAEVDQLLKSAYALYRSQKFDEALAKLNEAAKLNPRDFRPLVLAGYLYSAQAKLKSASASFAAAIRLEPKRTDLYMAKAQVDSLRNAHEEALAGYRKVTELDPQSAEAYVEIGGLLAFDKKRRSDAVAALQAAIKINPTLPRPYEILGSILEDEKDFIGAEKIFRQGMAADPKHMGGRFPLGRLLVKQGKLVEARELWEGRVSDEDRTMPSFIDLLKRAENLKKASDALAQQPKDADALINMGFAVMEGDSWVVDGRQEKAIVYFKQALALKPDSGRAQYGIVKAMIQIADTFGKEKKALALEMAKLRKLDPNLADEMKRYEETYHGGLIGISPKE